MSQQPNAIKPSPAAEPILQQHLDRDRAIFASADRNRLFDYITVSRAIQGFTAGIAFLPFMLKDPISDPRRMCFVIILLQIAGYLALGRSKKIIGPASVENPYNQKLAQIKDYFGFSQHRPIFSFHFKNGLVLYQKSNWDPGYNTLVISKGGNFIQATKRFNGTTETYEGSWTKNGEYKGTSTPERYKNLDAVPTSLLRDFFEEYPNDAQNLSSDQGIDVVCKVLGLNGKCQPRHLDLHTWEFREGLGQLLTIRDASTSEGHVVSLDHFAPGMHESSQSCTFVQDGVSDNAEALPPPVAYLFQRAVWDWGEKNPITSQPGAHGGTHATPELQ